MTETPAGSKNNFPVTLPTIFADMASVCSGNIAGTVRFHLVRVDHPYIQEPDSVPPHYSPVCQVVMPIHGFVNTALFLASRIDVLLAEKAITTEELERFKKALSDIAGTSTNVG